MEMKREISMKLKLLFTRVIGLTLLIRPVSAATLYVDVNSASPTPPYADLSTAATAIQDAVNAASNGDLILVNDGWYQDGTQATKQSEVSEYSDTNRLVIAKLVTVQSLNGPTAAVICGGGTCRCAYLTNGATLSGFTLMEGTAGWSSTVVTLGRSVTKTIAANGGGVSGPAPVGGVLTNCVLTANTATANGGGAYGVTLINCVLNGNQATNGGAAYGSTLTGCLVTGNQALPPAQTGNQPEPGGALLGAGGGLCHGSAVNCVIAGNSAFQGGGTWGALDLINCTIVNNSASFYGGICPDNSSSEANCQVTNSIIYFNNAGTNDNYGPGTYGNLSISYSCTLPLPTAGLDNFTNDPDFEDFWGGDYHPADDSPLINSGNTAIVTNSTDLDGNPRIVGGAVDIGAYEYPTPTSVISYAWLQQYNFPTDGSADFIDSDGDGMNNWQEWIAGTNPTNAASVLTLASPVVLSRYPAWVQVTWQSVNNRTYYLQRSTNLCDPSSFTCLESNLTGQAGSTSFIDTSATGGSTFFYRVGVQ
jgi:hypothetical protein